MRIRGILTILATIFCAALLWRSPAGLSAADGPAALTGVVRSAEEGAMEGVVVSARATGAHFYVSVVSDAKGRYAFPRTHLAPGTYTVTMRAAGYDLTDPGPVQIAARKTTTRDLSLAKTADLTRQLSSREYALSMPGPDDLKQKLVRNGRSCVYCHSLERTLKSRHTAEQFVAVISRMTHYDSDGSAVPTSGRAKAELKDQAQYETEAKSPNWAGGINKVELANYLATVNLSGGRTTLPFALKALPRPKGIATRAIVTTWEIPRKDAVAHDSEVDSKGRVWYNEENAWVVGVLDPKTNTFTEYPLNPVEQSPGVAGARDIVVDKQDNVWLPLRRARGVALHRFNPRTRELTKVEGGEAGGQWAAVDPDGKHVWSPFVRVDINTARVDGDFRKPVNLPPGQSLNAYGFAVNSKGNPYGTDFAGSRIVGVDVKTNHVTFWPTRQPSAAWPRRARMDAQDRFWFGLYGGEAIGMLDTNTGKMTEWPMPIAYSTPYNATVPDRNGYVYSASTAAELILRLNPKTGEVIEFPMPNGAGNFDVKKMAFDPTTKKPVLLFANTRNAEIMRVELPD